MAILIISTGGLIYDGITNVIVSYLEAMDLTKLDIYVAGSLKIEPGIRKKIKDLGCRIVIYQIEGRILSHIFLN